MTSAAIREMLVARAGDQHPGLLFEDQRWTWGEVVDASAQRAQWALSLRRPGPFHIAVCLENVPEYLFWVGAAALAGATIVGVNTTRPAAEIARDVRHTDCQLLITDRAGFDLIGSVESPIESGRTLVIDTVEYASTLSRFEPRVPDITVDPSTLLLLLFTSGSTGAPKAVCCSSGRLAERAAVAAERYGFVRDDVCYCAMPLFHGNAMMAVWAPALRSGATMALARRFTASGFLRDVRRHRATFFNYVGRTISYLLATPEQPDDSDNTLRRGYGTEASWKDMEHFRQRFGCELTGGYGMSEGGGVNVVRTADTPNGALGRPTSPTIIIVDPDTSFECPPAEFDVGGTMQNPNAAIGEIINTAGVAQFEGYYNNPEANAERTRNGWFWTGDLAYRDELGFLWFAGRSGDRLRVDSENFSATPIETVLYRYPPVVGVAVYPVPDPDGSDAVMAALELAPGVPFDPLDFATFVAAQPDLASKWNPQFVRIVAALPQTATGKVAKNPLRISRWEPLDDGASEVWWRPERRDPTLVRFDDASRDSHVRRFAERGVVLIDVVSGV